MGDDSHDSGELPKRTEILPGAGCGEREMSDAQTAHMVSRFLAWPLPETFNPDGGICFTRMAGHEPSGTNLLDATQARAMVSHMLEGLPGTALRSKPAVETGWLIELASSPVSAPDYWVGFERGFVADHTRAMRFARELDAATFAKDYLPLETSVRICQHEWS